MPDPIHTLPVPVQPGSMLEYAMRPPLKLPILLHYRGGNLVIVEIVRDLIDGSPLWVFRARKHGERISPATVAAYPTFPMSIVVEARPVCLHLATSVCGKKHLELTLREGWHLPANSSQVRIMDRLVAMRRATRYPGLDGFD